MRGWRLVSQSDMHEDQGIESRLAAPFFFRSPGFSHSYFDSQMQRRLLFLDFDLVSK